MGGLHSCDRRLSAAAGSCGGCDAEGREAHRSRRSMSMIAEQASDQGATRRSTSTFQWAPRGRPCGLVSSHSLNESASGGLDLSAGSESKDIPVVISRRERYLAFKKKLLNSKRFYRHRKERRITKDQVKVFRDLLSHWKTKDLRRLISEYDASFAFRDLTLKAERTRPPASTLVLDLFTLFEQECAYGEDVQSLIGMSDTTDVIVEYKSIYFKAHGSILAARCAFFSQAIRSTLPSPELGNYTIIPVRISPELQRKISVNLFHYLLRYVYSGDVQSLLAAAAQVKSVESDSVDFLLKIKDEFGVPHPLDYDISRMVHSETYDILLDFTAPASCGPARTCKLSHGAASDPCCGDCNSDADPVTSDVDSSSHAQSSVLIAPTGIPCHASILASRSSFFRALLQRRSARPLVTQERDDARRITLDEAVIPRHYASVLVSAMYTDRLDLSLIGPVPTVPVSSLTEVQAIVTGKTLPSPIQEATEIYQIGRFLEFHVLVQRCEDVIASSLTVENLPSVFLWATEPHGSQFVRRQCVRFLADHFTAVSASTALYGIDEVLLRDALLGDFVQASELEVLTAVLRWGEQQVIRRAEDREPNLLAGTAHSVRARRRADRLSDGELRDLLAPLSPCIRLDYVLPVDHPVLLSAKSRGLFGGLEAEDAEQPDVQPRSRSWRGGRPRLFLPYYEEARNILSKRLAESPPEDSTSSTGQDQREGSTSTTRGEMPWEGVLPMMPDALYMVHGDCGLRRDEAESGDDSEAPTEVPVPDVDTVKQIAARVGDIMEYSPVVKKALACGCSYHRRNAIKQVRLRVLREFGQMDTSIVVLENMSEYYDLELPSSSAAGRRSRLSPPPATPYQAQQSRESIPDVLCTASAPADRRYLSEPRLTKSRIKMSWPDIIIEPHCSGSGSNVERDEASMSLSLLVNELTTTLSPNETPRRKIHAQTFPRRNLDLLPPP